jgi:DNA-binding MarR family transcriptional regulator
MPSARPAPRVRVSKVTAPTWTFLTNHAHVLLCVARDADLRIRDLATRVGITERAIQRVIADLEEAGYVSHERTGRRNRYRVEPSLPLRHPLERHKKIALLLDLVRGDAAE